MDSMLEILENGLSCFHVDCQSANKVLFFVNDYKSPISTFYITRKYAFTETRFAIHPFCVNIENLM